MDVLRDQTAEIMEAHRLRCIEAGRVYAQEKNRTIMRALQAGGINPNDVPRAGFLVPEMMKVCIDLGLDHRWDF